MLAATDVRFATLADAAAIAELSREAIEHGLPWSWKPERVRRSIQSPDTNVVMVDSAGELQAFGIMFHAEEDAHLLLFAVREASRRRGVGSALLAWLEDVARAAGASRIRVEARRDNAAARNFYNEHGYHELSIIQKNYSGLIDGIRLEKWLRHEAPPS